MRAPLLRAAGIAGAFAVLACAAVARATPVGDPPEPRAAAAPPALVVFLTIDQLRTDYLARFGPQLTGGLKRLVDGGAFYVNGVHDHAITETAPGHASTLSGRFPVRTGIVMNAQGVNTPDAPLLDAAGPGASPFRFRGTTLADWMKAADRRTKVLSVSRKDRGAILPIGKSKQPVFWFADGRFTSSTYYFDDLPDWVKIFNSFDHPGSYAGKRWELLLPADAYSEPDSVPQENGGRTITFPKLMPADGEVAARSLPAFPWMDDLTVQFALAGMTALKLGTGPQTDLLTVSLSTLDAVGHAYGPDSREVHDMVLRLDRTLGAFLDSLDARVGQGRYVVALTGDHGVAPYIGVASADPNRAARTASLAPAFAIFAESLAKAGVDPQQASLDDGVLAVAPEVLRSQGKQVDQAVSVFLREARSTPGILRADRLRDLAAADTVSDYVARRWLHMFDPRNATVVAIATIAPYGYWQGVTYATHGSPHDYDARVPVLFWGAGIAPGRRDEPARVVDMAPTLAALLGVRPQEALDGRPLTSALAPR
ncbi:MAG: alkaline phosphatase family protein [Gemmatimonadota bacterium]